MSGVETKHTTFTFTKGEPALVCFRGEAERTSRLQANAETLLQDHSTAAGGGITAEVTQKSRGNFVLTSQGAFQRFSTRRSTTKKKKACAAEELARRKLNITPGGKGREQSSSPERGGGAGRRS